MPEFEIDNLYQVKNDVNDYIMLVMSIDAESSMEQFPVETLMISGYSQHPDLNVGCTNHWGSLSDLSRLTPLGHKDDHPEYFL